MMVSVTEGTSPEGGSSVMGSVLMVVGGKSGDRYHFSLSTSSMGKTQAHCVKSAQGIRYKLNK